MKDQIKYKKFLRSNASRIIIGIRITDWKQIRYTNEDRHKSRKNQYTVKKKKR